MSVATDVWSAREIAEEGLVFRCLVGSGVLGLALDGTDDRDEMGMCIEPPDYVIGMRKFEQYIHRTQPEGVRSGPGDLDLVVYSLRKWMRLALAGNPTVLLPLFVPDRFVVANTPVGVDLRRHADRFVSRDAGQRFLGYMRSQREQMLGLRGRKHTNRPELVAVHGFDTKFAYHMVRLGMQGVEFLTTGRITLPMPEPERSWLLELRRGEHPMEAAVARAQELERELERLIAAGGLDARADHDWANGWLIDTYLSAWEL